MVNRNKLKTRGQTSNRFGGCSSDLDSRNLSTTRDLIQFYYFIKDLETGESSFSIRIKIRAEIKLLWMKYCPEIPLLEDMTLESKIRRCLEKVDSINLNKKGATRIKGLLTPQLDRLFDISGCQCKLPDRIPCNDR